MATEDTRMFPRPLCMRCKREVTGMNICEDMLDLSIHISYRCHGDFDQLVLSSELTFRHDALMIKAAVASMPLFDGSPAQEVFFVALGMLEEYNDENRVRKDGPFDAAHV